MGQYYQIVNIDKRQYLSPRTFSEGVKLLEFGCCGQGAMTALAILLADGNGRGGGDLHSENPIVGSWAGDRIVVAGDYADEGKFILTEQAVEYALLHEGMKATLYSYSQEFYKDVSLQVLDAMLDDRWILEEYEKMDKNGNLDERAKPIVEAKIKSNKKKK